jgi:hypothetical protein
LPYAEYSDFAVQYGTDPDDAVLNAKVTAYIEMAHAVLSGYLGYDPTYEDDAVKVLSSAGKRILSLPKPLMSFTKVAILDQNGDELEDVTDYVVALPNQPLYGHRWLELRDTTSLNFTVQAVSGIFPTGLNCVEITGDWGFETSPILKMVTLQTVKHLIDQERVNMLLKSESNFGRSVVFNTDAMVGNLSMLPQQVQVVLSSTYKIHREFSEY